MITNVLRKMGYEGTYIYVLQYNFTFQYLFAWNNEVYRQEITILPHILSAHRWEWWLGFRKFPYSQEQLEQGEQVILSGAMKSIDLLKQDRFGSQRRRAEKKAKKERQQGECLWQVRANRNGEPIYLCLTHNVVTAIEQDKKPVHS